MLGKFARFSFDFIIRLTRKKLSAEFFVLAVLCQPYWGFPASDSVCSPSNQE